MPQRLSDVLRLSGLGAEAREVEALEVQRDDLLAALDLVDADGRELRPGTIEQVRDAIAKARGGA